MTSFAEAPLRVLVVDDDPLSRKRMRTLLEADPEVRVVGECADGVEGARAVETERPDLVLLDVQMPRLDGFGLVDRVGPERMPVVVFASAYEEFALRAFEACALDYLLKPFDDERFGAALARAKAQVRLRRPGHDPRLAALLDLVRPPERSRYPEVIAIRSGDQYPLVRIADIDWIEAEGNYARLHLGTTTRLLSKTLTALETHVLDPAVFLRIHRSTIVNLSRIVALEPLFHGELSVVLRDGARLTCSRRYRPALQDRILFSS